MKGFIIRMLVLLCFLLLLVPDVMPARNIAHTHPSEGDYVDISPRALRPMGSNTSNAVERDLHVKRRPRRKRRGHHETVQIAGSKLPDCAHACGSCSPCRLAMVSFKCSRLLAEAETCPMAYKCICNTKSFPVP